MKKLIFTTSALAIVLTGCVGNVKESNPVAAAPIECPWPNTNIAAPGWVCDIPLEGLELQGVASYNSGTGDVGFDRDQATSLARGDLASQLKTKVDRMIKNHMNVIGKGDNKAIDARANRTLREITSETVEGSKRYRHRTHPTTGASYVVVGFTDVQVKQAAKKAIRTSMNNNEALWQEFKAKQSFDEMAKAISESATN
jgi:hypothetical protein